MTVTQIEQVNRWIRAPKEHQGLEFKEAKHQFDSRKLCEYCVALANEGGGHFILGVSDRPPRRIVGTSAFPETNKIAQEIFRKLAFRVDVESVAHPDGRVVVFHIPSRPSGTVYNLDGKYLMRSGEELVPMSEDRLRKIFDEGKPDWLEGISREGLTSRDVVELLDTQTYFEMRSLPYPTTQNGVISRLLQDRLIREFNGDKYAVVRLGGLLLAKRLEDFPDLSRRSARVVVYSDRSKLETRLDQVGAKGYAVGFEGLIAFVMAQLPQNEVIEGALRREQKLISEVVIRELVANAFVHQDFSVTGGSVMIEIYANRVEISNPGLPIVPIERFVDGYQSRNERLAALMRNLGVCEEKGSGIDHVISTVEMHQLPPPDFGNHYNRTFVKIFGPKKFEAMDREDRIRACYQHACLKYVISEPMTNKSLRDRFGLPESKSATVSQVISATIEEKLIRADERAGQSKRLARYLPFWA